MDTSLYIPFCGLPPVPAGLWQRWVLDPVLLTALLALLAAALLRSGGAAITPARRGSFVLGWAVLVVALVSPLCALSVALFAARATQHMLLLVVAAPLLALGMPALLGPRSHARVMSWLKGPAFTGIPTLAFAALLWAWHVPALYDSTFRSDVAYWAMHLSLLFAALPLWMQLLMDDNRRLLMRTLLGFATFMQMGLLGALLTLSPNLLYESHVTTTLAWGISPLADQQLGGLIMWIPGCSSLLLAMLAGIYRGLRGPAAQPAPAPAGGPR